MLDLQYEIHFGKKEVKRNSEKKWIEFILHISYLRFFISLSITNNKSQSLKKEKKNGEGEKGEKNKLKPRQSILLFAAAKL